MTSRGSRQCFTTRDAHSAESVGKDRFAHCIQAMKSISVMQRRQPESLLRSCGKERGKNRASAPNVWLVAVVAKKTDMNRER